MQYESSIKPLPFRKRSTGLEIQQLLELWLALDKKFWEEFTVGVILTVDSRIRILPHEFAAQGIEKYTLIQTLIHVIFFSHKSVLKWNKEYLFLSWICHLQNWKKSMSQDISVLRRNWAWNCGTLLCIWAETCSTARSKNNGEKGKDFFIGDSGFLM